MKNKKLRDLFINLATSGKYAEKSEFGLSDFLIRYVLFNAIVFLGVIILLAFSAALFGMGAYREAALNLAMACLALGAFIIARTKVPQIVPAMILMLAYGLLCVMIIRNGEAEGANFTFIYMYPPLTMMLLGMAGGAVLSSSLLALVAVEVLVPGASRFNYPAAVSSRLIVGYVLVFFVMLVVETTRKTKDRLIENQNRRLAELKDAAEAANRTKSNFLASMSHEIRTPMNAIVGMTELLLRGELSDEGRGYAGEIKQAGANLISIINDLLDFSKIEAGRLEIVPTRYFLSSLLNDTVSIIRMRIMEKPIRFYTNIDGGLPNSLIGDEVRLRQILLNLLGNAVKYTERGSISVIITGSSRREGNRVWLTIEVADSGLGIKDEDQPKLFSEFVQVDTKKNRGIEGTGLGLAITKRLCEAMGGDITVSSEYGAGSIFTVRLPQEIGAEAPFAVVENREQKRVLVYEGRRVYADSVCWSLENLQVPHVLVEDEESFKAALTREAWYFVFSGYGLYGRIRPIMDCAVYTSGKRPPLALMVEWGIEAYIPGVRFVSLPVQSLSIADVLNGAPDRKGYYEAGRSFTGARFTAPQARLLVVDDISANLKVAEGLLTPYKTMVDTCLSGTEAVKLVQQRNYDIVFMDHMMPDMDGIEAVSHIRAWETGLGPDRKRVPIVALTANAVSGMREMFLEKGFDDFLAKPIDVSRLDEMMGRWIDRDKREKVEHKEEDAAAADAAKIAAAALIIPGVDVKAGIDLTGGTEAGYRQVLSLFCKDAEARLPLLQSPPEEGDLSLFTTQVHALKSASASIGAAELSAVAARLEAAGREGDLSFIRKDLPGFSEKLAQIAGAIRSAMEKAGKPAAQKSLAGNNSGTQEAAPVLPPGLSSRFMELLEALESQQAEAVDRILEAISQEESDPAIRETLDIVSDEVLMTEFEKAADIVRALTTDR